MVIKGMARIAKVVACAEIFVLNCVSNICLIDVCYIAKLHVLKV